MDNTLKLEQLLVFVLSMYLFSLLNFDWWWYLALFFVPDIGFLGYLVNTKVGALCYNILHHKGVMIILYLLGIYLKNEPLQLVGIVFLGHAAFDRVFGYGLKYNDSFHNTHLGKVGKAN